MLAAGALLPPRPLWHLCFSPNKALFVDFFFFFGPLLKSNVFAKLFAVCGYSYPSGAFYHSITRPPLVCCDSRQGSFCAAIDATHKPPDVTRHALPSSDIPPFQLVLPGHTRPFRLSTLIPLLVSSHGPATCRPSPSVLARWRRSAAARNN